MSERAIKIIEQIQKAAGAAENEFATIFIDLPKADAATILVELVRAGARLDTHRTKMLEKNALLIPGVALHAVVVRPLKRLKAARVVAEHDLIKVAGFKMPGALRQLQRKAAMN